DRQRELDVLRARAPPPEGTSQKFLAVAEKSQFFEPERAAFFLQRELDRQQSGAQGVALQSRQGAVDQGTMRAERFEAPSSEGARPRKILLETCDRAAKFGFEALGLCALPAALGEPSEGE